MRKWSDRVTTRHGQARHAAVSETSTVIIIHTSLCFFLFCLYFFFLSQQSARLITPNLTFWPISHIPLLLVCGGVLSARSPQVMTETTNTSLEKELHRPSAETMVNK